MNSVLETNTIVSFDRVKADVIDICRYLNRSHPHLTRAAAEVSVLKENQRVVNDTVKELIAEVNRLKALLVNLEPQVRIEKKIEPVIVERKVPQVVVKTVPKVIVRRVPKVVVRTKVVRARAKRKLVASKTGGKVHNKHCAFAKQIKRKNKTVFNSIAYAHDKGYRDCACVA